MPMEDPSSQPADNIGARARTAAGWQFLSKGITTGLQVVTTVVLARLLMPEDFGIIAMAAMVTGLARVFEDLGLGQALVQRKELREEHTRAAFWGTLVMAVLIYTAISFGAPYVGAFFDEPRMIPVLMIIALTFVLSPFAVVPRSMLQRKLDFRTLFFASLASSVAYGAVGITMALMDYGYWALVGASLAGPAFNTVALCALTRYLPPIVPGFRGIADLYRFGVGMTGVGIGYYIATKIDYFIIGRQLDADALGLYSKAYSFITYPAMMAGMVSPVFFPAFSRMQDDHARMRSAYGRAVTLIASIFFPVLVIAIVAAPEFIPAVFGEQWTPSVVPAQILMLLGLAKITGSPTNAVIKATGRVFGAAWRQFLYGALIGIGTWFAAPRGINAVAVAVACVGAFHSILIRHLVWSAIGFGISDFAKAFRAPLVTLFGTGIVALLFRFLALSAGYNRPVTLVLTVLPAALIALLLTVYLPLPELREAVREIKAFSRRGIDSLRPSPQSR